MAKARFQKVKGTRDFYPEEMAFQNWLFGKARQVSKRFGYEEYEGPILEPLELYAAKSGEELVKKQTFSLKDRGGRRLALRPEMTPTLARMVAQKQEELPKPIRWFAIGPRFRYEQPQKGRTREFYQWDVDLIGSSSPEADAEVIAIAATFLKELGFSPAQVKIKVNDRALMEQKLSLIGIRKGKILEIFSAIDKKDKMEISEWEAWLTKIGLTDLQAKDLKGILKDKDFGGESENLTRIFSTLKDMGVAEYVEFNPGVVRGLDYYTGVVFEAQDTSGEFRSILGGGRYDNLVEVIGGKPLPGVGFACGDAVLEEFLKKYKKIPDLPVCPTRVLVTVFDEAFFRKSIEVASLLRGKGINTEAYPDARDRLDKQLKYADQKGIPYAVIIGPEEEAKGVATVKNMKKKTQEEVPLKELIKYFD